MLAKEGQVIDNLVLIGTTIPTDSELYYALLENENVRNVIRIDIEGDNVDEGIKALPSFMIQGDNHPHFKCALHTDSKDCTKELACNLQEQGVK